MAFCIYDPLKDLNQFKYKWKIKVRVLWTWKAIPAGTKDVKGLNIMLIDDGNTRIQVFVDKDHYKVFDEELISGRIYEFRNFAVKQYSEADNPRTVRIDNHLFFNQYTKFEEVTDNDTLIPHYGFDIFDLSQVSLLAEQEVYLTDVVGVVENIDPVQKIMTKVSTEPRSLLSFLISDGKCSVPIKFWGEFADSFIEEVKKEMVEQLIVIITCCKAQKWSGEVSLTSYPATKFFLNYNHYCIKTLRNRLSIDLGVENKDQMVEEERQLLNLNEITELGEDYVNRQVDCKVVLQKIADEVNWFSGLCIQCQIKVPYVKEGYKCTKCLRKLPLPNKRFNIHVTASDNKKEVSIIILDDEIKKLTGLSVLDIELLDDHNYDVPLPSGKYKVPNILLSLLKKPYKITIQLNADNAKNGNCVYMCTSIQELHDEEVENSENQPVTSVVNENDADSLILGNSMLKGKVSTPPTDASTNTVKIRKNHQAIPFEMAENIPLKKLRAVKRERAS